MPLYIDGARLGYRSGEPMAPTSPCLYLAHHCDVFYIGGTKVGALCGEAVVFTHHNAYEHFFSIQKQHGAVLAKGHLLGLQFDALFTDDLYFRISRHAIDMAEEMKQIFFDRGYRFYIDSPTNQQFVIISNDEVERPPRATCYSPIGDPPTKTTPSADSSPVGQTTEEELRMLKEIINKGQ